MNTGRAGMFKAEAITVFGVVIVVAIIIKVVKTAVITMMVEKFASLKDLLKSYVLSLRKFAKVTSYKIGLILSCVVLPTIRN